VWTREHETLNDMFGSENSARLASVYKDVLASVAEGQAKRVPSHPVRLAIVTALLAAAAQGEFDPSRLKQAALSAIGGRDLG
jgi:hypothetical protein